MSLKSWGHRNTPQVMHRFQPQSPESCNAITFSPRRAMGHHKRARVIILGIS